MELAIGDITFSLRLNGVGVILGGILVTVDVAVSTGSNDTPVFNGGWIEGKREVLLLCGGNGNRGDLDDAECGHDEIGGKSKDD